jgi:hypothetical protein
MFVLEVPISWIERYKKIMKTEECTNYNQVFIGLIEMYEEALAEEEKKNATKQ